MPDSSNPWEKSSAELVELFSELAPDHAAVAQKKMFGWPCCFANGNLFFGLHKQTLLFRLPEPELRRFLTLKGAAEFEPMPGRKMSGYGVLTNPMEWKRDEIVPWIRSSLDFALTLPPKQQKASAKATAGAKAEKIKKSRSDND